jgi:nucleotide-binding universal stress UspA family protein
MGAGGENVKILVAIDGPMGIEIVIREAARRPWPAGSEFRILHVADMAGTGRFGALIDEEKRLGHELVKKAAETFAGDGRKASTEVLVGFPRSTISEYAKQWGADFVMVGSHGANPIARFLLGSVAQATIRVAHCSVEVVRRKTQAAPGEAKGMKILLATDGSECAAAAAKSVAERPWPAGSEVKIISAVQLLVPANEITASSSAYVYPPSLLEEVWNDARNRARDAVAEARKTLEAAGIKIASGDSTPDGDPRIVLTDLAKEWPADLIVLGSHGRRGMDRLLMGSVSEFVAMHAHCSVEVIRK